METLTLEQHNEVAQSIVGMAEFLGRGLDRMSARIAEQQKWEREAAAKKLMTDKIWSAIAAAIKVVGGELVREAAWSWAVFGGEKVDVSVEAQQHRGSWRSTPTGFYNVVVGDYGNKKVFPPTKSGHSYDKIAAELAGRAASAVAARTRAAAKSSARAASQEIVDRIKAARGIGKYDSCVVANEFSADRVGISISRGDLTESEAAELLECLARIVAARTAAEAVRG